MVKPTEGYTVTYGDQRVTRQGSGSRDGSFIVSEGGNRRSIPFSKAMKPWIAAQVSCQGPEEVVSTFIKNTRTFGEEL